MSDNERERAWVSFQEHVVNPSPVAAFHAGFDAAEAEVERLSREANELFTARNVLSEEFLAERAARNAAEASRESWEAAHDEQVRVVSRLGAERDALAALLTEAVAAIEMYVAGVEGEKHAKATIGGAGFTASSSAGGRRVLEFARPFLASLATEGGEDG